MYVVVYTLSEFIEMKPARLISTQNGGFEHVRNRINHNAHINNQSLNADLQYFPKM